MCTHFMLAAMSEHMHLHIRHNSDWLCGSPLLNHKLHTHHTDEVHLGRRAPCGRGSSGEESTTQARFIWGGEHRVDEVRLGRRAPRGRGSSGEEREGSRPIRQTVANLNDQRCACVTLPTYSDDDVTPPSVMTVRFSSLCSVNMARSVPTSDLIVS